MVTQSALVTTLFFGGWDIPGSPPGTTRPPFTLLKTS